VGPERSWTTVVVLVAAAEPVVAGWRASHDRWAGRVPAHITVFAPFVAPELLDAGTVLRLGAVAARLEPFSIALTEVLRLQGALCLLPESVDELGALGAELADAWPDAAGAARHAGRRFHLTVGRTEDAAELARMETAIESRLPLVARIDELLLFAREAGFDPRLVARFRLGT
jgi:2'-5' RNA ligase